jgi:hypothetical protein
MICPLGPAGAGLEFERSATGALLVNGVPVTDRAGWLTVELPRDTAGRATATTIGLRLRVARDMYGRWFVDAEEIALGGRRLGTLFEVMAAGASAWLRPAADAVLCLLRERGASAPRYATGKRPIVGRAAATPEPDDDDAKGER